MELKPGYKQTEVGVIPEEWEVKQFRDAYSEASRNGVYKPAAFHGRGTRIVNMGELFGIEFISDQDMNLVQLTSTESSVSELRDGDLLFGRRSVVPSGAGKCSLVIKPSTPLTFESSIIRTRLNDRHFFPLYGYYYFSSPLGKAQVGTIVSGTNVKGVRASELGDLKIPWPPHDEQIKIAEALRDVDGLLESLQNAIAKKREIKQAAMQELLTGKRRLPGFEGEWEVKSLREIAKMPVTDGPHMTPRFLHAGVPFLSVNNLVNNRIDFGDLRFISKEDHLTFSRKCKPQKGDILLGKAASVGKVAIVDSDVEFNIWSPIALIRIAESSSPRFVFYALQSHNLVGQITLLTNASSQGNIGLGDIERLTFRLPSKEEQTAIASTLHELDTDIAALEARMEKAQHLKQGMLQQLLTGRIRLK